MMPTLEKRHPNNILAAAIKPIIVQLNFIAISNNPFITLSMLILMDFG